MLLRRATLEDSQGHARGALLPGEMELASPQLWWSPGKGKAGDRGGEKKMPFFDTPDSRRPMRRSVHIKTWSELSRWGQEKNFAKERKTAKGKKGQNVRRGTSQWGRLPSGEDLSERIVMSLILFNKPLQTEKEGGGVMREYVGSPERKNHLSSESRPEKECKKSRPQAKIPCQSGNNLLKGGGRFLRKGMGRTS